MREWFCDRNALRCALIIVATLLVGCVSGLSGEAPTPTPDLQATVDAAVGATAAAEAEGASASMVATDVAATQTAVAGEEDSGAVSDPTPSAPEVSSEDYVTMTEEELAVLIDDAVNEAVVATEAAAAATETATADDALTQEDVESIEVLIADADDAIALAEELLYVYGDLYAELATESLVMVDEMEALLSATTEMVVVLTDVLVEVDTALDQGTVITAQMLQDLEEAADLVDAGATALQQLTVAWPETLESELSRRAAEVLAVPPTEMASSRVEAILSAYDYIEVTRGSLSDFRISQSELSAIAQMGANAAYGLQNQGGPQLQGLADKLNEITMGVAKGQLPQMQVQLQSLESLLPARPARP